MGLFGDSARLEDQFYITRRSDWHHAASLTSAGPAAATTTTTTTAATTAGNAAAAATVTDARSTVPRKTDSIKRSASPQNAFDGFVYGVLGLGKPVSIKGTVHLNFPESKPVLAHRIEVRLSGKVRVWWQDDKHRQVVQERIIDRHLTIWESSQVSGSSTVDSKSGQPMLDDVPLTRSEIDFSLDDIPHDLPSIEIAPNGQIRYKIQAIIHSHRTGPSSFFLSSDAKTTVEIQIRVIRPLMSTVGPMSQPHNLELPNKCYWYRDISTNSRAASVVPGSWECVVGPSRCLGPFEPLELSLQFRLAPHVSVKRIFFGIKQYSKIYNAGIRHQRTSSKYIASTERADPEWQTQPASSTPDAGATVSVRMAIARPLDALVTTGTSILRIFHNAKVKVYLKGAKNIKVEAPLFITPLVRSECDAVLRSQFGETASGIAGGIAGGHLEATSEQVADPRLAVGDVLPAYDAPSYDLPPYPVIHDHGDDDDSSSDDDDDDNDGNKGRRWFDRKQKPPPEYSASEKH